MRRVLPALALLLIPAAARAQPVTPNEIQRIETLRTSRGRLGVEVMPLNEELRQFFGAPKDRGVLVAGVEDGSPAKAAGVEVGDVIQRVDGKDVASAWDVISAIAGHKKGDKIDVDVVRAKRDQRLSVTLIRDARPARIEAKERQRFEGIEPNWPSNLKDAWRQFDGQLQLDPQGTQKRLEELEKRIEQLEKR